ncbi:MAG: sulfurtransferase complex subunit TusB [Methylococcales symbiont of Iophon sp. n. MRB-2018]|nr:MAG: sulfurtransferase complex subunit TusB [Methylococcales symbiont of Iophon sp. n. MRB-2018]KAF3979889.1 MAG: sulfurtransferase complex subunit TusB [Methylococcales symbiont of Iophon sp. n. MRB-2018]
MLHLIFQSVLDPSVLQRIGRGDDVVFMENAVLRLYKENILSVELLKLLKNNIHLYVLNEDLETRGIEKKELVPGVKVIDYLALAQLTETNALISSWN